MQYMTILYEMMDQGIGFCTRSYKKNKFWKKECSQDSSLVYGLALGNLSQANVKVGIQQQPLC